MVVVLVAALAGKDTGGRRLSIPPAGCMSAAPYFVNQVETGWPVSGPLVFRDIVAYVSTGTFVFCCYCRSRSYEQKKKKKKVDRVHTKPFLRQATLRKKKKKTVELEGEKAEVS